MEIVDMDYGQVQSALFKLSQIMGRNGGEVIRLINSDPSATKRLSSFLFRRCIETSADQRIAAKIMGDNYIGPEDVAKWLGVSFTEHEVKYLERIPFNHAVLEECRANYVLFAGYPKTIMQMESLFIPAFTPDWLKRERFATDDQVGLCWYLMRIGAVPGSLGLEYRKQLQLLPLDEEVPRACELMYGIKICLLARQLALFQRISCNTGTLSSGLGWHEPNKVVANLIPGRVKISHRHTCAYVVTEDLEPHRDEMTGLSSMKK